MLLAIPHAARLWARCGSEGRALISGELIDTTADVLVVTGRRIQSYPDRNPGRRFGIALDSRAAASTVHIAQFAEGHPLVETVQIAAQPGSGRFDACGISAQAIVTRAGATGG